MTGGAGVIGRPLVERLHATGATVLVGDRAPRPSGWPASIRHRPGDLRTLTAAELAAFAPEVVFHLAATFERTVEDLGFLAANRRDNVELSGHLLSLLAADPGPLERIVFASSYLVYDASAYLFDAAPPAAVALGEGAPLRPRNACGAAKLLHETELELFSARTGVETLSARIFRVYGRGGREVVSRWVAAALAGEPIATYALDGRFDYVLADDVAEGLLRVAAAGATGVVNLGSGRAHSPADVLDALRAHAPELRTTAGAAPAGLGVEASVADLSRLEALTGWTPPTTLAVGIEGLVRHARDAAGTDAARQPRVGAHRSGGVLVTSAAAKVPLLRAVRAALGAVGAPGAALHAADLDPDARARWFADAFWAMPPLAQLDPQDVLAYCAAHRIGLVVPTRDGELAWWARHRDALAEHGVDVLVSGPEAVAACLDKLAFAARLQALGEPAVLTAATLDELGAGAGGRLVVKERVGSGSRGVALDVDAGTAARHAATLAAPVFQPYVDGVEHSVDFYADRGGRVLGVVARRRDVVVAGESQVTTTVRDPELEERCARIAEALGIRGHAVLQVIVDPDGGHHVLECNARFGGASTLALAAGLDSFAWALLEARGEPAATLPFRRAAGELRQVRHAADLVTAA